MVMHNSDSYAGTRFGLQSMSLPFQLGIRVRFRLIGGSFGNKGNVLITEQLQVFGDKVARYDISDIDDLVASRIQLRIQPCWWNITAVVLFIALLTYLFTITGFVLAVLLAVVGFLAIKIDKQKIDIRLLDGNFVSVTGSKRAMSRLITL